MATERSGTAASVPEEDVVALLMHQHGVIRDLFDEVAGARGDERRDAFRRLTRMLAVHETAEEEIVHPAVRRAPDIGAGVVDERLQEENEAKRVLSELDDMEVDGPDFARTLDQLRVAVLTHARREERYEFPALRRGMSPSQVRTMAAAVKAAEAAAPTRPHPGVESAAANLLVGPAAAVFDRARDLVQHAGRG